MKKHTITRLVQYYTVKDCELRRLITREGEFVEWLRGADWIPSVSEEEAVRRALAWKALPPSDRLLRSIAGLAFDIAERIEVAKLAFTRRTGKTPKVVYLGADEYQELEHWVSNRILEGSPYSSGNTAQICGLHVFTAETPGITCST